MTSDEFKKEFYKRLQLKSREYSDKKDYTILPRLTGNLKDNAFTTKFNDTITFYVDDTKAPYSQYIDSIKWGKGWWDNHFTQNVVLNDVNNILIEILGKDNVRRE